MKKKDFLILALIMIIFILLILLFKVLVECVRNSV